MTLSALRSALKIDGFLLAMLAAVGLALSAPSLGAQGGPLHLERVTAIGIALVFFLHGAALSMQNLRAGASNWRLHAFVQTSTYVLFPCIGWLILRLGHGYLPDDMLLGMFYLCVLSSTISSSVAMTAMAGGNIPGAIFNATLSSLLGMVLTPILIGLVAHTEQDSLPLGQAVRDIALQLLLPFVLGQAARPWLKVFMARFARAIHQTDRFVILLIVYASFSESTQAGLWSEYGVATIVSVVVMTGLLLAMVLTATIWTSRRLGFSKVDEITAVFCGSKKSLAGGIPIARLLFGSHPALGMIVLPIMIYHQLQLIACTILARRYATRLAPMVATPMRTVAGHSAN